MDEEVAQSMVPDVAPGDEHTHPEERVGSEAEVEAQAEEGMMTPLRELGEEVDTLQEQLAERSEDDSLQLNSESVPPEGVPPEGSAMPVDGTEIMSPLRRLGDEVEGLRADLDEGSPPRSASTEERVCRVVCPPGVAPGEMIAVEVDGTTVEVEAPEGVKPGEQFEIVLGVAPSGSEARTAEEDRRVEAENAAAEQAAVCKIRREKKAAKVAERRRPPPASRGTPQPRGTHSSFADRQAQASAEKKLRLDAKRRLQMQAVTGAPSAASSIGQDRVSPSAFAERQAVLNADRAARLAHKQKAKAEASTPNLSHSGPKVNLREFTARQDMHLEEQRERRKVLEAKRKQAEKVVFPKRTVNMAEFAARLEETNKQKKENIEAKRLQRQSLDGFTGRPEIGETSRKLAESREDSAWSRLCSPSARTERLSASDQDEVREVIVWKGFRKTTYLVNQRTKERTEVGTGIGSGLSVPRASATRAQITPQKGRRPTPPKQQTNGNSTASGASGRSSKQRQRIVDATKRCVAETEAMNEALASVQTAIDAMLSVAQAEGLELELGFGVDGDKGSVGIVSLSRVSQEQSTEVEEADSVPEAPAEPQTILVTCPEGVESGEAIIIDRPDGTGEIEVVVPDGVSAGGDFEVEI